MLYPKVCFNEPFYKEVGRQVNKKQEKWIGQFCLNQLDLHLYKQELRGRRYCTCIGQNNRKTSKSMEREI